VSRESKVHERNPAHALAGWDVVHPEEEHLSVVCSLRDPVERGTRGIELWREELHAIFCCVGPTSNVVAGRIGALLGMRRVSSAEDTTTT
jgi:hypothetical protein